MRTQNRLTACLAGAMVAGALLVTIGGAQSAFAQTKPKQDEVVTATDKDSGRKINISVGGKLVFKLKSNPTTGFSWAVAKLSSVAIQQVGKAKYVPDPNPKVGSGGTDVFTFKAVKAGKATLTFTYQRAWEKNPPVKKVAFEVTIVKATPMPTDPGKRPAG
jgi:predicted secreted protein